MIQTQILLTNIIRVVWEKEKRITYEILGVKGLRAYFNELINAFVSCNTLQTIECAPLNNEARVGKA